MILYLKQLRQRQLLRKTKLLVQKHFRLLIQGIRFLLSYERIRTHNHVFQLCSTFRAELDIIKYSDANEEDKEDLEADRLSALVEMLREYATVKRLTETQQQEMVEFFQTALQQLNYTEEWQTELPTLLTEQLAVT